MDFNEYIDKKYKSTGVAAPRKSQVELHIQRIPAYFRKALFISNEPTLWNKECYEDYGISLSQTCKSSFDPSEIITSLPIGKGQEKAPEKLTSYSDMSKNQRRSYLTFLSDIKNGDTSYFSYLFFSLERNIFLNRNISQTVRVLAKVHRSYKKTLISKKSNELMAVVALKTKDPEIFSVLSLYQIHPELLFLIMVAFEHEFTAIDLMFLAKSVGFTDTEFMYSYPDRFERNLTKILLNHPPLNFSLNYSVKTDEWITISLQNPSLPIKEYRFQNLISDPKIRSTIYSLLEQANTSSFFADEAYEDEQRRKKLKKILKTIPENIYIPTDGLTLHQRLDKMEDFAVINVELEESKGIDLYIRERFEQAENRLLPLVKNKKASIKLYLCLSRMYQKQARYLDAIEFLTLGLELLPKHPALTHQLSTIKKAHRMTKK
ncbi:hypothetical protein [Enterococcus sp. AZ109]|uniref:tetratricopeptide repeat protein n=1 Tax=Enterococcus sp. AZ109 TaxID=2774634 RepID=UPI003F209C01